MGFDYDLFGYGAGVRYWNDCLVRIGGAMTRDDLIKLAREACVTGSKFTYGAPADEGPRFIMTTDVLEHFANLVAAHEREECAKVAGIDPRPVTNPERYLPGAKAATEAVAKSIADAIRARGEK